MRISDWSSDVCSSDLATGEARAVDIAQRMGVRQATVTSMVRRLQARGLATSEPYRAIFLTDAGRARADRSRARHAVVLRFLLAPGVDREDGGSGKRVAVSVVSGVRRPVKNKIK